MCIRDRVEADPSLAEEKPEVFDTFNVITNSEFRKAVKEFRERLRMMSTIEEEETISDDDEDEMCIRDRLRRASGSI